MSDKSFVTSFSIAKPQSVPTIIVGRELLKSLELRWVMGLISDNAYSKSCGTTNRNAHRVNVRYVSSNYMRVSFSAWVKVLSNGAGSKTSMWKAEVLVRQIKNRGFREDPSPNDSVTRI